MSAWIVSKNHIDVLVDAIKKLGLSRKSHNEIGELLWKENHRSVNFRYHEHTVTPEYEFKSVPRLVPLTETIKQVHCYDYQTCETDDYRETEAGKLMSRLLAVLLDKYREIYPHVAHLDDKALQAHISNTPSYQKAAWGV